MLSQTHYLVRSRSDGKYLVARINQEGNETPLSYLLLFQEHFDALSYLNTHGSNVSDRFSVESIPGTQLKGILQRWGFDGVGLVRDPLIPRVEFLSL
ncbi:hypothetical protein [Aphanothece sacrum]|uniref:Uncharacterized protein n=1 Tax=Aphanothece sacrum FPU1 TaxID=1920663 RepID=A0A401IKU2_APHSA|nr:hypothetical protein [Aphanothece sacrum]GBF81870.1 hypothetical protein AsFPU1_3292 [Aphanothece sacrum FPU1]GBF85689.1 hypothetical protein AsFPU3_2754 [Aphanothece sacrum FPU3]